MKFINRERELTDRMTCGIVPARNWWLSTE